MSAPLASVAMITYNHAPYIAEAIQGVLRQKTGFRFELVIGEDCSTDGTREIVLEYGARHPQVIRVVTSERNVGADANIRRTTDACRGRYIAWCEGDDYWHRDDKLQMQISYLEAHPDCGLVCSDYDYLDAPTGRRIEAYNRYRGKAPPTGPDLSGLLRGDYGVRTCTACARLDDVRRIMESDPDLYSTGRFLMTDAPLFAEVMHRSRMHYFDESLATYRVLPESASRSRDPLLNQRFQTSFADMRVYFARKYDLPAEEIREYEQELCDARLRLAFFEGSSEAARAAWAGLSEHTLRRRLLLWGAESAAATRLLKAAWLLKRRLARMLTGHPLPAPTRPQRQYGGPMGRSQAGRVDPAPAFRSRPASGRDAHGPGLEQ